MAATQAQAGFSTSLFTLVEHVVVVTCTFVCVHLSFIWSTVDCMWFAVCEFCLVIQQFAKKTVGVFVQHLMRVGNINKHLYSTFQ